MQQKALSSILAIAGLTGGWFFGRSTDAPPMPQVEPPAARSGAAGLENAPPPEGKDKLDALELIAQMKEVTARTKSSGRAIVALYDAVEGMSSERMGKLVAELDHGKETYAATQLAGYWAEIDLPAAKAWLARLPQEEQEQYAPEIVRTWLGINDQEALDWLEQLPTEKRRSLGVKLCDTLAENARDPERVMKVLADLPSPDARADDFGKLFARWSARDPAKAGEKALEITASTSRSAAVSAVAAAWAAKAPAAARAWLEGITDAVVLVHAQAAYASGLAQSDPVAAMDFLSAQPLTEKNRDAYLEVSKHWVRQDATAAVKWLRGLEEGNIRNLMASGMFDALAETKPQAAKEFLVANSGLVSPWDNGMFTLGRFLANEGRMEPVAAWANQLPEGHAGMVLRQAARSLLETNQAQLQAWALAQPEGQGRAVVLQEIAEQIASRDFQAGLKWAEALPAGPSRTGAVYQIAPMTFTAQPNETSALLLRALPRERAREAIAEQVLEWAANDRAAAANWLKTTTVLPAGELPKLSGNR